MRKIIRIACAVAASLCLALSANAAEKKEESKPIGPPQPRVVEPLLPQALPPRAISSSWLQYQDGQRLFKDKRLGESLQAFKKAIDEREALFRRCSEDIGAALATKEAAKARGSLSSLVALLALRDMIAEDYAAIHERAAGSMVAEMGLIRERSPSAPLRGLIDAALLVVEERGLSRVHDSLDALRKASADLESYPEAEFWIGKVYLAEGEARLAELQIRRAYDMSASLELGDERYAMLEALAGIYRSQGDLKSYEQELRAIADATDLFSDKSEYYRNSMERTLAGRGFDKFMSLYRIQESYALPAYSALGSLYLDAGRPLAVIYLAAAVNASLTRVIEAIKVDYPSYSYAGLADIEARILGESELARFAAESGLWRDLYKLGEGLAASGYRESAREIWSALAEAPATAETTPWRKRAAQGISGAKSR